MKKKIKNENKYIVIYSSKNLAFTRLDERKNI